MAEEKEKKKEKKPTALKRGLQDKKKHYCNKQFIAKTKTSIKNFLSSLEKKDDEKTLKEKLTNLFSHLDKCAKKRVFKKNKVNRLKSKYHKKLLVK